MNEIDGEPVLEFPSRADLEAWLDGADEAVDIGLCFGWISAVRRSHDDGSYLQRYARRRPASKRSRIKIAKVAELTAAGRMRDQVVVPLPRLLHRENDRQRP